MLQTTTFMTLMRPWLTVNQVVALHKGKHNNNLMVVKHNKLNAEFNNKRLANNITLAKKWLRAFSVGDTSH
eukprot:3146197-Amphidinium_carterae.1